MYLPPSLNNSLQSKPAKKAITCTVLPNPISSPKRPPKFLVCSSHSHFTETL